MRIKQLLTLFLTTIILSCITTAKAEDVILDNQSRYNIVFTMNADPTKATGYILANTSKTIEEANFKEACMDQTKHCELGIYLSGHNKKIGTLIFQETTIVSISNHIESHIWIVGQGSHIRFKNK